jgi:hypothetical protein
VNRGVSSAFITLLAFSLPACTIARVYNGELQETHLAFGVVEIRPSSQRSPLFVDSTGMGVNIGRTHELLGWFHEQTAVFPDPSACAAMLYIEHPSDLDAVISLLTSAGVNLGNLCVLEGS